MTAPEAVAQQWNDRLHLGDFAGPWSRGAYLPACLAGVLLAPTGIVMWWLKRRRGTAPRPAVPRPRRARTPASKLPG